MSHEIEAIKAEKLRAAEEKQNRLLDKAEAYSDLADAGFYSRIAGHWVRAQILMKRCLTEAPAILDGYAICGERLSSGPIIFISGRFYRTEGSPWEAKLPA